MQNKFIKQDTKLLSVVRDAIKGEIKRRNLGFNHEVFNTKHLTECSRRIYYRANAEVIDNASDALSDMHVKFIKKKWVEVFESSKKSVILDKQVVAADANYNLFAEIDAIVKIDGYVSVLMVDLLDSPKYEVAKKNGALRCQMVELMTGAWLTDVSNGILLCENRKTGEYFLSHMIVHRPIIETVKSSCRKLMEQNFLQQVPDRPYDNSKSTECLVCEYRGTCWKSKGE